MIGILQKLTSRVKGLFAPVREEKKSRVLEEPQAPRGKRTDFSTISEEIVENKKVFFKGEDVEKAQGLPKRRMNLPEDAESWSWESLVRQEKGGAAFPAGVERDPVDGREISRQIEMESRRYCPNLEEDSW